MNILWKPKLFLVIIINNYLGNCSKIQVKFSRNREYNFLQPRFSFLVFFQSRLKVTGRRMSSSLALPSSKLEVGRKEHILQGRKCRKLPHMKNRFDFWLWWGFWKFEQLTSTFEPFTLLKHNFQNYVPQLTETKPIVHVLKQQNWSKKAQSSRFKGSRGPFINMEVASHSDCSELSLQSEQSELAKRQLDSEWCKRN